MEKPSECSKCKGTDISAQISHSEKNPERGYYRCDNRDCGQFLGWTDGVGNFSGKRKRPREEDRVPVTEIGPVLVQIQKNLDELRTNLEAQNAHLAVLVSHLSEEV